MQCISVWKTNIYCSWEEWFRYLIYNLNSNNCLIKVNLRLSRWLSANSLPAMQDTQEMQVWSLSQKIPWRKKWKPTLVSLPGKFHGQRSLAAYSSWDWKSLSTRLISNNHLDFCLSKDNITWHFNACHYLRKIMWSEIIQTHWISPPVTQR